MADDAPSPAAADQPLGTFIAALAAKTPVPGGGAAAALSAALGCAAGAMACRYTSGERYADVAAEAAELADRLDAWRLRALGLADADAAAYAAVRAAKAARDPEAVAAAEQAAAEVPAELIALCAAAGRACAAFRPRCNPWLVSDIETAIHLLSGAGRAAWRTLLVNDPSPVMQAAAHARLSALAEVETPL